MVWWLVLVLNQSEPPMCSLSLCCSHFTFYSYGNLQFCLLFLWLLRCISPSAILLTYEFRVVQKVRSIAGYQPMNFAVVQKVSSVAGGPFSAVHDDKVTLNLNWSHQSNILSRKVWDVKATLFPLIYFHIGKIHIKGNFFCKRFITFIVTWIKIESIVSGIWPTLNCWKRFNIS